MVSKQEMSNCQKPSWRKYGYRLKKGWHKKTGTAAEFLKTEETLASEVVDTNTGGLLVDFGRITGFVPNSLTQAYHMVWEK